jgi:hypothetical protein
MVWMLFAVAATCIGCFPYVVANTAQTVFPGERMNTVSVFVLPDGVVRADSGTGVIPLVDSEWRWGLKENADIGVRVTSFSGINVNYKRRLTGRNHPDSAAISAMFGLGTPDFFLHASADVTLMASLGQRGGVVPYAGVRAMYATPLRRDIVLKSPAAGAFLGLRLGNSVDAVLPEIGVYYDEPADDLRRSGNIVVIPSISLRGFRWLLGF